MNYDEIDRRAREINADNTVRQKGTRTRASLISYFDGEDLTETIHRNANTYAAFISVLTDSGASGFKKRNDKDLNALWEELGKAFKEAGFVSSDGELSVPGQDDYTEIKEAIGPLMPAIVAILEVEYGINSTEAVRQYRPESLDIILPNEGENQGLTTDERPEKDWERIIRNAPGSDPDAEAYVYVLELDRLSDSSTWFYVGQTVRDFSELPGYVREHARKFDRSRAVTHDGEEILLGDHTYSMVPKGVTHHVVDVERVVPISGTDLESLDDSDAESCYIDEIERRTAYEVALNQETTNVLGGK